MEKSKVFNGKNPKYLLEKSKVLIKLIRCYIENQCFKTITMIFLNRLHEQLSHTDDEDKKPLSVQRLFLPCLLCYSNAGKWGRMESIVGRAKNIVLMALEGIDS